VTPYPLATVRGSADGRRVLVEGAGNPQSVAVLEQTQGSIFCIDVALPQPMSYMLQLYTLGVDGQVSESAAEVGVEFDPAAAPVPGLTTCSGSDPAGCPSNAEICDNNRDDDCNNLVDEDDPACATCVDDPLEPNDDLAAPRLEPGRYENLAICPGNQDVYGVFLQADETLTARIFFTHFDGNLDMTMIDGGDLMTVIGRSTSVTDDESLTHTATAAQEVKVVINGESGASNSYTLELRVESGS
jgi:hypothetical protein